MLSQLFYDVFTDAAVDPAMMMLAIGVSLLLGLVIVAKLAPIEVQIPAISSSA